MKTEISMTVSGEKNITEKGVLYIFTHVLLLSFLYRFTFG